MKKKIIVSSIVLGAILVFCLAMIGVKARFKKQEEQENILKIQAINAENVLRDLAVDGEVVIQDDRVVITVLEFREYSVIMKINYFNAKTESALTLEQIKEQFELYTINGEFCDENTKELEDFCSFIEEEGIMASGACPDYVRYDDKVVVILAEMETSKWEATREQLEEACQKALEELDFI